MRALILEEQARCRFIEGVDLHEYLAKLDGLSEILSVSAPDRCRGIVAFYCNDESRQAYITLVLVDARDRGRGLGRSLVDGVLDIARRRGYRSCRLEVGKQNETAQALYASMGFRVVEDRAATELLELAL